MHQPPEQSGQGEVCLVVLGGPQEAHAACSLGRAGCFLISFYRINRYLLIIFFLGVGEGGGAGGRGAGLRSAYVWQIFLLTCFLLIGFHMSSQVFTGFHRS